EEYDLAFAWQMSDVALEVPLAALSLRGGWQCDDPRDSRAQIFGDPLDRTAFAGCISSFEDHQDAGSRLTRPFLELDQLRLHPKDLGCVYLVRDLWQLVLRHGLDSSGIRSGRTETRLSKNSIEECQCQPIALSGLR